MTTDASVITIGQYIQGKLRNIKLTEDALVSALLEAGAASVTTTIVDDEAETVTEEMSVGYDTPCAILTEKQRDLTLAGIYVWAASSPSTSARVSDEDGDWSHSEGGERLSDADVSRFLRLAKALYDKWNVEFPVPSAWGFRGTGFRYKRK